MEETMLINLSDNEQSDAKNAKTKKKKKTRQLNEEIPKSRKEGKTNEETEEEEEEEEEEQIGSHQLLASLLEDIYEIERKIITKKQISMDCLAPVKEKIRTFACMIDEESNMKEIYKEKYLTKAAKIREQKLEIKNLETENKTYAQITAEKKEKTNEKVTEIKENPKILLKRKNDKVLVAEVENELAKIDDHDIDVKSSTMSKMGNITITLKTEESKVKLVQRLKENVKLQDLAEVKELQEEKKKIIIFNIPSILTDQEVIDKTKSQLNVSTEKEIDLSINRFPERNGYTHMVIQLPKKLAEKIIEQGRLLIGLRSCGLKEYKEVVRCRGCKGYGHTSATCRLLRYCGYCAEPTHDSAACPHKEDPSKHQCVACLRAKIPMYKHSAFSRLCLTYIKEKQKLLGKQNQGQQMQTQQQQAQAQTNNRMHQQTNRRDEQDTSHLFLPRFSGSQAPRV